MHLHHWNASFECYKPSNVPGNVACPWCMPRKPQRLRDHQRFRLHNGSLTHRIAKFSLRHEVGLDFAIGIPPSRTICRLYHRETLVDPLPWHTRFLDAHQFSNHRFLRVHSLCFAACFPRGGRGFSVEPPIADSRPFPFAFFPLWWLLSLETQTRHSPFWRKSFSYVPFFPRLTDSRGSRLSETSCESNSLRGIGIMDVRNSGFRVFDNYLTVGFNSRGMIN